MAFPLPTLLPTIEELLQEVQWLDGLILVTDSARASFVSFSQVDPLLRRLRMRPRGHDVAEKLCMSLLESHGKGGAKPVLVFQGDGSFWLGLIGPGGSSPHRHHAILPPLKHPMIQHPIVPSAHFSGIRFPPSVIEHPPSIVHRSSPFILHP